MRPAKETTPEIAKARAAELERQVNLHLGDVQQLDFDDESFDNVVCTLAICTIPDPQAAVAEAFRVLKPAGFDIEQLERSKWGIVERVVARKPASAG